jgi:hypothetical protein
MRLSSRIARALAEQLAGRSETFSSDLQIGVPGDRNVYADVTVVFDGIDWPGE